MTYVRVNWADGSGGATPIDQANLNIMDAEIAALDTAVNSSQTPSESATPAASGSVATLLSFIVSQLKLISGGAHWYSAPAATLASLLSSVNSLNSSVSSLSSSKVNKSGDTMTGTLTVVTLAGAVSVGVESSQTVFRTGAGAANIVIQVNGHNWVFDASGNLTTPSGAVIH